VILPSLHIVVTDAVASDRAFVERAQHMQEACGESLAIHLRVRHATDRQLLAWAEALEEGAVETDGWLVVNGRVDVALAVGAEAVQLGRGHLPIDAVRDVAGESLRIGASVHDVPTADRRRLEGADYLLAGSVYHTATHPGIEPAGVALVELLAPMSLPVIAIGGISVGRVGELRAAGAAGVAVVSAVWNAADPGAAAAELCRALEA
jgi:thiamine-phosphate pyrophosphorylase